MNRLITAALGSFALLAVACSGGPTRASCERLLEHTIELEQTAAGLAADAPGRAEQKQALLEAGRESFLETCEGDLPERRVRCALKATTKAELLACDEA